MSFYMSPFIFLSSMIMLTSSIMAMSSSNWMFLWAAMELNLLSFIPLLINSKKFQETEAAIKYFLAQALGSSLLLMSSMSMWFNNSTPSNLMLILLIMSITLKLGIVPCHLWYPSVMASISWMSCLILSSWQKLAPLMILAFIMDSSISKLMVILASLNALMGGIMGMNQSSLRTIMAYSSITHMGWMLSLLAMSKPLLTMMYFLMYTIIITPMFLIFHMKSITISSNMSKAILSSPLLQMILPLMLLSLGGLPPLTGFIPKWMTIYNLSIINPVLTIILIIGSMMNTYYYLNIVFNFSLSYIVLWKSNTSMHSSPNSSMSAMAIFSLLLFPLMMLL